LAGNLQLSKPLAEMAFEGLARRMSGDGDSVALADGVLGVAVAKMAGAVREVSVHRGFDPRDFALLGFGGAGPMHVFLVAEELAIPHVLIPRFPGHLSALGQLLADLRLDFVNGWGGRISCLDVAAFRTQAAEMREHAQAVLVEDGFAPDRHDHTFSLDMRYVGQSYTLSVNCDPDIAAWQAIRADFGARHAQTFGHDDTASDVEIVNIRLVSRGLVEKPGLAFSAERAGDPLIERRSVWFGGGWTDCPIYDRTVMSAGFSLEGPAIIEEPGGTSVVPPGWHVTVHASGSLDCRLPAED